MEFKIFNGNFLNKLNQNLIMNNLLSVLLTNYSSGPEAIVVGLLQGLLIWGVVALFRGAKKTINGKKFEEVKEDKNKNKTDNSGIK